ncbi:hypothetical protein K435DRAFT_797969 [Dendrothele bispora CBS 962.96]|uniref:Uncharacterized protein n=1 Tax=Dendrothele bispora (strain CBS 962.96) TaxID=1314807 RepID=A0A4S8M195_DENBC|nr:hypothetical protein K435DRAFT_797969 [Dendrothele bispora CBS 962.96]
MPGDPITATAILECDNCQAQVGAPLIYCRWHGIRVKIGEAPGASESEGRTILYFRVPERVLISAARNFHRANAHRQNEIEYSDREDMPEFDDEGFDGMVQAVATFGESYPCNDTG